MTVRLLVGDVRQRIREIPNGSVDLVACSPPFLALRKYGDDDREMGSERTPADFLDALLELTTEFRRVLAPHGSIAIELGDTYSGSGGGGGDYLPGGLREGQPGFTGSAAAARSIEDQRAANARHWREKNEQRHAWPLPKSLTLIPTLYPASLAYGWNMLNPAHTFDRWRVRNLLVWARPNPPVGKLGDKVRPATSYITVACTSAKRWFDLDAVREPYAESTVRSNPGRTAGAAISMGPKAVAAGRMAEALHTNSGAPPLDWWEDDDPTGHATLVLPTQPFSGWTETVHQVRVPVDAGADGSQRTASPDCPVHASQDRLDSTPRRGGREAGASTRNGRNGSRLAPEPGGGSLPMFETHGLTVEDVAPDDPAATRHSTPSNRTAPARATTPPDTPSARTPARTGDTPAEPESSVQHPGTPPSSTAEACPPAVELGTEPRTADTSNPLSACTCSWWVEVEERHATSHYATWPETLAARLIKMMCPLRVCRECGKPSERISDAITLDSYRSSDRVQTKRAVELADLHGLTDDHIAAVRAFGTSDAGKAAVINNGAGKNSDRVKVLAAEAKDKLGGYFREFVMNTNATMESTWSDCGCRCLGCNGDGEDEPIDKPNGYPVACVLCGGTGHAPWRPGVVLDPFAGSGTTLAVAQGLGRDAWGIELYPRNAELCRERVGLFLEVDEGAA